MDRNRRFSDLLGKCWHEPDYVQYIQYHTPRCRKCNVPLPMSDKDHNPDYANDPRLVLREMKAYCSERLNEFLQVKIYPFGSTGLNIPIDLILDQAGTLLNLAIAFLEREACPNCKETANECACIRNRCICCGKAVGNITFTYCEECWEKL